MAKGAWEPDGSGPKLHPKPSHGPADPHPWSGSAWHTLCSIQHSQPFTRTFPQRKEPTFWPPDSQQYAPCPIYLQSYELPVTLRVSLSFSWQKRLPNYSSYQTAAVSRLILTGSAYIMHTQGTKNPWKNNFSWKLKDPTSTWGFHFLSLKQRFY